MKITVRNLNTKSNVSDTSVPYQLSKDGKSVMKWFIPSEKVVIPEGVQKISQNAFFKEVAKYVKHLVIPDSVTHVANDAFRYMRNLQEVDAPDDINPVAFRGTPIYSQFLDDQGLAIRNGVLLAASRKAPDDVIIPDGVTIIKSWAFYDVPVESVSIPSSLSVIERGAFTYTRLKTVVYRGQGNMLDNVEIHRWGNEDLIDAYKASNNGSEDEVVEEEVEEVDEVPEDIVTL